MAMAVRLDSPITHEDFDVTDFRVSPASSVVEATFATADGVIEVRWQADRADADTLIAALNDGVRDGTGKTLQQHLMERAVADGAFEDLGGAAVVDTTV